MRSTASPLPEPPAPIQLRCVLICDMYETTVPSSGFGGSKWTNAFPFYYGNWSEQNGDADTVLAIVFGVHMARVISAIGVGR
jgi:hypothetical protein